MSYTCLDMDNLRILFKVPDIRTAGLLSALEHLEVTQWTFPTDWKGLWRRLSMHEMRILLKNSTGEDYKGTNVRELGDKVLAALEASPMSDVNGFRLMQQAGPNELPCDAPLTDADLEGRTHVSKPAPAAPPRSVAPSIPPAPGIPSAPPLIAQPWAVPKAPAAPSIPSAPPMATVPSVPRAPTPPSVPKAPPTKGATGRVWEIADEQYELYKKLDHSNIKLLRAAVIEACEAEGLNPGTAATQFGKWKASKQL